MFLVETIRSLFKRSPSPDRERLIFVYRLSRTNETRRCDPLVVSRKLDEHGGENWAELVVEVQRLRRQPNEKIQAIAAVSGTDVAAERAKKFDESLAKLVAIVRAVFDLKPFGNDGTGYTEAECVDVLTQYLAFSERLAEDARPL